MCFITKLEQKRNHWFACRQCKSEVMKWGSVWSSPSSNDVPLRCNCAGRKEVLSGRERKILERERERERRWMANVKTEGADTGAVGQEMGRDNCDHPLAPTKVRRNSQQKKKKEEEESGVRIWMASLNTSRTVFPRMITLWLQPARQIGLSTLNCTCRFWTHLRRISLTSRLLLWIPSLQAACVASTAILACEKPKHLGAHYWNSGSLAYEHTLSRK